MFARTYEPTFEYSYDSDLNLFLFIQLRIIFNTHVFLVNDACDLEESEEQIELNLYACTPK